MTETIDHQDQIPEDKPNKQKHIQKITGPIILLTLTTQDSKLMPKINEYCDLLENMSNNLFYSQKKIIDSSTGNEITKDEIKKLLHKVEVFLRPFQEKNKNEQIPTFNPSDKAKKMSDEEYEGLIRLYAEYDKCIEGYRNYRY